MEQLASEIDESASDVIDSGMFSHVMSYSRDELKKAMLSFPLSVNWLLDAS